MSTWCIVQLLVLVLGQGSAEGPYVVEVTDGKVKLLSGADDRFPPVSHAESGDLLVVVEEQSGWSRVQVPAGFTGWVHSRYVTRSAPGRGTVNANDVNFRVQPSSTTNNLPVGTLSKGTEVFICQQQDEWMRVSSPPELTLWVHSNQVKRAGELEAFTPKLSELRENAEKAWLASAGAQSPASAAAPSASAATFAQVRELLGKAKSDTSVDLTKASAELKGIQGQNPSEDDKKIAADLLAQIEAVEGARRASALAPGATAAAETAGKPAGGAPASAAKNVAAEPRPAAPTVPPPVAVPSKLAPAAGSKYAAVGWLSATHDPRGAVYLRKGGIITYRLSCPDGRYRLQDFADREVGVTGKVVTAAGLQPMVEVETLEILRK
jgi:SH3-like domain-containing protein